MIKFTFNIFMIMLTNWSPSGGVSLKSVKTLASVLRTHSICVATSFSLQ